jgi:hypothetical protein
MNTNNMRKSQRQESKLRNCLPFIPGPVQTATTATQRTTYQNISVSVENILSLTTLT